MSESNETPNATLTVEKPPIEAQIEAQSATGPTVEEAPTLSGEQEILAQESGLQSEGCAGGCEEPGYLYAIGTLSPVFPSESLRMEFNQIVGRIATVAPDNQLIVEVLSQGEYLYLARELCWIFSIQGVDAYLVRPRSFPELLEFIQYLVPNAGENRYATVVGPRGGIAGPEVCAGLQLPMALANQFYHFTYKEMVEHIVAAAKVKADVAESMLSQMLQLADNAGDTDEHRAINYLTLRYMGVYEMAANMLKPDGSPPGVFSLKGVIARPANVQGTRRLIDVIFQYEERSSRERIQWYCRVDVSGQFPFLVSTLSPYYPAP